MNSRIRLPLLSALLALLLAGACGGGPAPVPEGGAAPQRLTVELLSFDYEPREITLTQGQPVELTLVSADIEHTFTVEELGLDYHVGPGETRTVTFTPQSSGEFRLICTTPGHLEAGMEGTVAVR